MTIVLLWFFIAFLCLLGELSVPGTFFLVGFSLASLCSAGLAWAEYSLAVQLVAAVGLSTASFILTFLYFSRFRPKKSSVKYHQAIDTLIGKKVLISKVLLLDNAGYVWLNGQEWLVRWDASLPCYVAQEVVVIGLKGGHLLVEPC